MREESPKVRGARGPTLRRAAAAADIVLIRRGIGMIKRTTAVVLLIQSLDIDLKSDQLRGRFGGKSAFAKIQNEDERKVQS